MKNKRSFKRIIMHRFIGYTIGIALTLLVLELLFSLFTLNNGMNFSELASSPLTKGTETVQITLSVLWILITAAVYFIGIVLFGRGISRKVMEPVQKMEEGFKEVTAGHLDTTLDFETETEFGEMRDAFNYMSRKLKDSEEKRRTMEHERMRIFSHIAHDLKTPMTTISGYAGALASGLVEEPDRQREYHLAIQAKSGQMNQLIDQLLTYSKLGAPQYRMNFAKVDLAELLRISCADLFGEIESKQMLLDMQLPDQPVYYMADRMELNRAIGNLLTNAIRHNPEGSLLSVGLTEEPGRIMIHVADNGAAIPEAIAGSLFEPFVSGSDSRSTSSGTGLGLAIVNKVMEQHSGEVVVLGASFPYTKMFVLSFPKDSGHRRNEG
ncbi:HAMP domain-containing sensor histidine kinase [Paenibacillus sp. MMS20-IR301]|uniref:HAMP domain-containing sensor histidine kinase n=1 Tax=Paenibacillus sp. MMS20-IR301 TaxID=2895946 RepID=UPI0028EB0D08|nr:HAMP domain-containing sensor histidine kinase [Paenibacillus sp. MMS20-IR301]WNS44888.1 HAMP domain-containing sensor histidine kinase [Paenibacillus sp. MMS20-IR301]